MIKLLKMIKKVDNLSVQLMGNQSLDGTLALFYPSVMLKILLPLIVFYFFIFSSCKNRVDMAKNKPPLSEQPIDSMPIQQGGDSELTEKGKLRTPKSAKKDTTVPLPSKGTREVPIGVPVSPADYEKMKKDAEKTTKKKKKDDGQQDN